MFFHIHFTSNTLFYKGVENMKNVQMTKAHAILSKKTFHFVSI